jgi:tRNA (Thr-GGU) A37 N-methylase
MDGFSHLWLLWDFYLAHRSDWSATSKPPRLGGRTHMGVWATRSPFRPNPLGLSCVELVKVDGLELVVKGADLMDGTPIYDIKPYIPYADAYPKARSGFVSGAPEARLQVVIPEELPLTQAQREALTEVLSLDPRPAYQDTPGREYGMIFDKRNIRFSVEDGVVTVLKADKI